MFSEKYLNLKNLKIIIYILQNERIDADVYKKIKSKNNK